MRLLKLFSFLIILSSIANSQPGKWMNYYGPAPIQCMAFEGEYLWVATYTYLTKLNTVTGELELFHTGNSGLPSPYIGSIFVDRQGNKWIGSDKGLTKFDGQNWKTFDTTNSKLPGNGVGPITADSLSNLWMGTAGGLVRFDGQNWTIFNRTDSGIPVNFVSPLAIDPKGIMWMGTGWGLGKFDGQNWTQYTHKNSGLPHDFVLSIAFEKDSIKWIGTHTGIAKFDDKNWEVYGLSNTDIYSIAVDFQGIVWAGSSGAGLYKFDGTIWENYNPISSGMQNNTVHSILIDKQGNKWFGTYDGLVRFDGQGWKKYKICNSGLPENSISAIAVDQKNNKWFGTQNGLAEFDGENWTVFNTHNSGIPDNVIWTIAVDQQGNKWIGTSEGGLAKYDGNNWNVYNTSNSGLPNNTVLSIAFDIQGDKWVGTDSGGVAKFDGSAWQVFNSSNSPLPANRIGAIAVDQQGNKWIGTYNGLAKFDGQNWFIYTTSNSGLPSNNILAVAVDQQGNKWIGTWDAGLVKYDGTNWTVYNTSNSGIPSNLVYKLFIDQQGTKWIGTGSDLIRFDGKTWEVFGRSNSGVQGHNIFAIAADLQGYMWIGTDAGLAVLMEKITPLPLAPVLLSVVNNSKAQPLNLTLSWNESSGAETYQLELAKDSLFSEIVLNDSLLTKFSREVSGLLNSTTYFWRVRAKNSVGVSPWSEVWKFTTIQALAEAPVLLLPKNNSIDNPLTITFSWKPNKNTDQYKLIVSEDDIFSKVFHQDSTLTDTLREVKDLDEGMKYYWRVSSKNSAGEGPYSEVWNLTTLLYAPEELEATVQGKKKIHLKWKDNSKNETGFVIERKTGTDFTSIDTVKANTTNYKDSLSTQASTYQYRVKAYTPFASSAYSNTASVTLTGVDEMALIPGEFRLFQNYPNPFNPVSTIRYWLPERSFVELKIFDMLGREVLALISEERDAGDYKFQFNATSLPSGVYIYTIRAGVFRDSKKFILLK